MTVAVSVTSGVVAVTSAFPSLSLYAVEMAIGLIVVLAANLRGTKWSAPEVRVGVIRRRPTSCSG
jgi:hypothetical protein